MNNNNPTIKSIYVSVMVLEQLRFDNIFIQSHSIKNFLVLQHKISNRAITSKPCTCIEVLGYKCILVLPLQPDFILNPRLLRLSLVKCDMCYLLIYSKYVIIIDNIILVVCTLFKKFFCSDMLCNKISFWWNKNMHAACLIKFVSFDNEIITQRFSYIPTDIMFYTQTFMIGYKQTMCGRSKINLQKIT